VIEACVEGRRPLIQSLLPVGDGEKGLGGGFSWRIGDRGWTVVLGFLASRQRGQGKAFGASQ
jgi:hypothetical protein